MVAMWWCYWSDAPCIRHAPYCDVQDANEMRTVENAKRNETYETIATSKKTPPLGMGGGGELIEKNNNKIALIVFNYSVTRVKL